MKDAISIPAESRPRQKDSMDELLAKFEYAEIKRCVDKRCREEEQVQMTVKPVGTVQRYCSPCSPNPDMPSNAYVKLDNEGKMGQKLEELTSSSSSTGLNTPGQQSPPDLGITRINPDNSPVHVTVLLIDSTSPPICGTVTCTGELSALIRVIPRSGGLCCPGVLRPVLDDDDVSSSNSWPILPSLSLYLVSVRYLVPYVLDAHDE